jgi:hypothetical protein
MDYHTYVRPLYLDILHANFLSANQKDLDVFIESTRLALDKLSDREFIQMYNGGNWREAITASWLCGIRCIAILFDL